MYLGWCHPLPRDEPGMGFPGHPEAADDLRPVPSETICLWGGRPSVLAQAELGGVVFKETGLIQVDQVGRGCQLSGDLPTRPL